MSFNRTFMELKFWFKDILAKEACAGFNRTFMELKFLHSSQSPREVK